MRGQEADDLPADLQARHIRAEIDPIQALQQIQHHLPVENIVDRHRRGHDRQPRRTGIAGASGQRRTAIAAASSRRDSAKTTTSSAVRGEASLVVY
jgi:hypothetical protein